MSPVHACAVDALDARPLALRCSPCLRHRIRVCARTARARRDPVDRRQLAPGDLLFFGGAGWGGVANEASIIHAGIYLGDNWVINSSGQGVYVLPLQGSWLGAQFRLGQARSPRALSSSPNARLSRSPRSGATRPPQQRCRNYHKATGFV